MRWFAIHHALAMSRKWWQLTMPERGAWITLFTISAGNSPRGTIPDRETAVGLLERDGATADEARAYVDALIGKGWIDDVLPLEMHDFDEWQQTLRKPSDTREAWRDRKRRQRDDPEAAERPDPFSPGPPNPQKREEENRQRVEVPPVHAPSRGTDSKWNKVNDFEGKSEEELQRLVHDANGDRDRSKAAQRVANNAALELARRFRRTLPDRNSGTVIDLSTGKPV